MHSGTRRGLVAAKWGAGQDESPQVHCLVAGGCATAAGGLGGLDVESAG